MSRREMLKKEIDFYSDEVISAIIMGYGINHVHGEIPNEDTLAAIAETEDIVNGRKPHGIAFLNVADMIKYIEETEDCDEES